MKNIIIAGSSRSGKTTLAKKIFFNNPHYNYIQEDILGTSVTSAYEKYYTKIEDGKIIIRTDIIDDIRNYLIKDLMRLSIKFEPNIGIILETYTMDMKELKEYQDKGFIVIVLGCSNITKEKFIENVRKYDTPDDRTYSIGNFLLAMELEHYIMESKENKKNCKKLGLDYIETSQNRPESIEKAYQIIKEKMDH